MAERLVQQSDLDKYPDLKSKGVSVNQHYDFDNLEQQNTYTVTRPIPPQFAATKEDKTDTKKVAPSKTTNGKGKK